MSKQVGGRPQKKYQFREVRLRGFGNDFPSEWVLVISSTEGLADYLEIVRSGQISQAFNDYLRCSKNHYPPGLAYAACVRAEARQESFLCSMLTLSNEIDCNMLQVLVSGDIIYAKQNGSYSFDTTDGKHYDILQEITSNKLFWPVAAKVKIHQWPQGRHWYATIDGREVSYSGKKKWNTYAMAQLAVKRFMESGDSPK